MALCFWLGIPFFQPLKHSIAHVQWSYDVLDNYGDHLLGCGDSKLRIKRHDSLCEILFHALSTDNSNCRGEQHCSNVNMSKPCDVLHPDFDQGLPTYFAISVRKSLQPS